MSDEARLLIVVLACIHAALAIIFAVLAVRAGMRDRASCLDIEAALDRLRALTPDRGAGQ